VAKFLEIFSGLVSFVGFLMLSFPVIAGGIIGVIIGVVYSKEDTKHIGVWLTAIGLVATIVKSILY